MNVWYGYWTHSWWFSCALGGWVWWNNDRDWITHVVKISEGKTDENEDDDEDDRGEDVHIVMYGANLQEMGQHG